MALFVFKILNLSEFTRKILEQDRYLQTKKPMRIKQAKLHFKHVSAPR